MFYDSGNPGHGFQISVIEAAKGGPKGGPKGGRVQKGVGSNLANLGRPANFPGAKLDSQFRFNRFLELTPPQNNAFTV